VASAAIHGLLLACWLNLQPVTSGTTSNVIIELVSIDSIPAQQSALPAPKQLSSAAEKKTGVKAPVVQQRAKPVSTAVVAIKKIKPTVMQVAQPPATGSQHALSTLGVPPETARSAAVQFSLPLHATAAADMDRVRRLLRNHLESYKYYPASARRRSIEGHVDVGFTLTRNGAADHITVLQGSGYAMLDRAAMQTVLKAQPFPADNGTYRFRLRFQHL